MTHRLETGLTIGAALLLALAIALILSIAVLDTPEEPTPTLSAPVVTLDACVTRCLEGFEPGTIEHRDCANLCVESYLEAEGE